MTLTLIVDCNSSAWASNCAAHDDASVCSQLVDSVGAFCNAIGMQGSRADVSVIAATAAQRRQPVVFNLSDESGVDAGALVRRRLREALVDDCEQTTPDAVATPFARPLALALCRQRRARRQRLRHVRSDANKRLKRDGLRGGRLLVITAAADSTRDHLSFMNSIFGAQKLGLAINAVSLWRSSPLLQQACDVTGGVCLRVDRMGALLQHLLVCLQAATPRTSVSVQTSFLPASLARDQLCSVSAGDVDYRPTCFCHQQTVHVGWVCSVCLSVFCQFSPICPTCQTVFKFLPAKTQKAAKKRKRLPTTTPPTAD